MQERVQRALILERISDMEIWCCVVLVSWRGCATAGKAKRDEHASFRHLPTQATSLVSMSDSATAICLCVYSKL
jgi:hypothetical protein